MRRAHFEGLRPICPRCVRDRDREVALTLAAVAHEVNDDIREGVLHCSDPDCFLEFPIIDGIPLLVPDVRSYISGNLLHLISREDLSEPAESLIGDGTGPGNPFDTTRQHLSTYAWDHFGDLDPEETSPDDVGGAPNPGSVVRCLERGLDLAGGPVQFPSLDIGCSVGRTTFELAARGDGLALGVDVNFAMLRLARRVLTEGAVRYARRRVGLVYDRREFPARFDAAERVDFWACDAQALPFAGGGFALAVGLNVLDCVASPHDLLQSLARILRKDGRAILSTPYDWTESVTPVEAWIGGHSQRGPDLGAAEPRLRSLLTPGAHPQAVAGLRITGEIEMVPWQVRLHERSAVDYRVHVVAARVGSA